MSGNYSMSMSCTPTPGIQPELSRTKVRMRLMMKITVKSTQSTFQRIPGESELADDVSGNICLDALAHLGLTLCSLQTLVKLLWVKLLQNEKKERKQGRDVSQCHVKTELLGLKVEKVNPAIFSLTNEMNGMNMG